MRTVDLFCGCGGMSLGFQKAGFDIVAAFDHWEAAVSVYRNNLRHPVFQADLSNRYCFGKIRQYNPQMIIGGPPCQDFSSAGKRDETLGRADLTMSFAEIVVEIRPEFFVMENVERIRKSRILQNVKNLFLKTGYGLTEHVLDASFCGVPQSRKRFFMIGHFKSPDGFLTPFLAQNQSKSPLTVFDVFGNSFGIEYYYRHPRSYFRRGVFSIYEPSPTIRGVNRPIPKGYKPHTGDPTNVADIRPLSTKERSLIQTFPESYRFSGTKTDVEQMIGNAVPVNLAKYVAECILEYKQLPSQEKNNRHMAVQGTFVLCDL